MHPTKPAEVTRNRKAGGAKLSVSVDQVTLNRSGKNIQSAQSLRVRHVSPKEKELKPRLCVVLQIEVAKAPVEKRAHVLETAYVVEEIMIAASQNLS